ncbi:MAG TPA: hypothetical protein PK986_08715 [Spirochaetota bacterium]|nr:hypothetical protein [Spirochaetota bacterium]
MRCRALRAVILTVIIICFILFTGIPLYAGAVLFHGKTVDVDLSDLESYEGRPDETAVRSICAEIVRRYHDRGYTAFYIRRAVLGDDGILEIYFKESVVGRIKVQGADNRENRMAAEIYAAGEVFNEYILKDNIEILKTRYMLSRLRVDVIRDGDGSVILDLYPARASVTLDFYIAGDPLRGVVPVFTAGYTGESLDSEITLRSSLGQGDVAFSSGEVRLRQSNSASGFVTGAGASYSEDSLDAKGLMIYSAANAFTGGGWFFSRGPGRLELLLSGSFYSLEDYPRGGRAMLFPFTVRTLYDDRNTVLDRNDYVLAEFTCSTGWNSMEHRAFVSYTFYSKISLPLFRRLYGFVTAESFFTTSAERLFGRYVFTGLLACRRDNYTAESAVHSAGTGFTVELMKDHIYLSPGVYGGVYGGGAGTYCGAWCAGADILWDAGVVAVDFRIMREISGPGDMVFTLSAGGRF